MNGATDQYSGCDDGWITLRREWKYICTYFEHEEVTVLELSVTGNLELSKYFLHLVISRNSLFVIICLFAVTNTTGRPLRRR